MEAAVDMPRPPKETTGGCTCRGSPVLGDGTSGAHVPLGAVTLAMPASLLVHRSLQQVVDCEPLQRGREMEIHEEGAD
ncbi:hypothetical protein VUR80DRAFT_8243 [Thermomyces stellatus]